MTTSAVLQPQSIAARAAAETPLLARRRAFLKDQLAMVEQLPRAMAFRNSIKLKLDTRRIFQQLRHFSTLTPALVPDKSPEPAIDRPLVESSLARLSNVIPQLRGARAERYWAGLVDLTPNGLPITVAKPALQA